MGSADFSYPVCDGGEPWAYILLPECTGAAFHWAGAVEEQRVEPPGHGWGLGGGQVHHVGDEDGLQKAEHHQ